MTTRLARWAALTATVTVLGVAAPAHAADSTLTVDGIPLAGSTVSASSTMTAPDHGGTARVKFYVDGVYRGQDTAAPFTWPLAGLVAGAHTAEARLYDGAKDQQARLEVPFGVGSSTTAPAPVPAPTPAPSPVTTPAPVPAPANGAVELTVAGTSLDGATLPKSVTVAIAAPDGTAKAKVYLDGNYLGVDTTAPFTYDLVGVADGRHELEVRRFDADKGAQPRLKATFDVRYDQADPAPPTRPTPTPTPAPAPPVTSPPSDGGAAGHVAVDTVAELEAALAQVRPGSVIDVAPGQYMRKGGDRWVAGTNGTAAEPITLRGPRSAVLKTDSPSGDYGLHVTGDHWLIQGITVTDGSKGIVLDGSVGTVLHDVEVSNVGAEAVHFRACSSDGVLRNSYIHDTGLRKEQYGEGVYVGSANSNWGPYSCDDGRDNTERVLIEGNTFENISAEGADLKEGTDSGVLRGNVFINAGYSGQNSADSAVDAKGNNWLIEDNIVRGGSGAFLEGFQTHVVYDGYGTGNVFRGNVVEGSMAGFGIGTYPMAGNVVGCSNSAPGAAAGLVGSYGKKVACAG